MRPTYTIEQLSQPPKHLDGLFNDENRQPNDQFYENKLKKSLQVAKHALQTSIVVLEVTPANEIMRYGILAMALSQTQDPLVGAAVLGGSTLVIEGSASLATADLLTTETSKHGIDWVNQKIEKIIPKNVKMSSVAEAGIAMYGGSVIVLAEKQRENPTRTKHQNRKHGIFTASWLSGVLSVEGALIAKGIDNYTEPKVLGAAILGLAGIGAGFSWARKQLKTNPNIMTEQNIFDIGQYNLSEKVQPKYVMSEAEFTELEAQLINEIDNQTAEKGIHAAWINPYHKYANLIRVSEAKYFPEVTTDLTPEDEEQTLFLALVDTSEARRGIVHGATVSGINFKDEKSNKDWEDNNHKTGFIVVDDLIKLGNFTAEEFHKYYAEKGIDLNKSISVETNFKIGKKTKSKQGSSTAQLVYNLLLKQIRGMGNIDTSAVFTSVNRVSELSFRLSGLDYEPMMGRTNLITYDHLRGKRFQPVVIYNSEKNQKTFDKMKETVQEMYF